MKIALVYDRVNKWGGAERVLLALHEIWPDAPLFTAVFNADRAKWANVFTVKPSFMQYIPFAPSHHEWFAWLTPMAFESFSFDDYDVVISVTSAEAKYIITKPETIHICYCLTPTRYLWSGYEEYAKSSRALQILTPTLRGWDSIGSSRPDYYIAISERVKARIEQYYGRNVEKVIYPPVNIQGQAFETHQGPALKNYFLVVSRLVPYKRIDLIVEAFNELKLPLVIIGSGSEEQLLRGRSSDSISFVSSHLTEAQLQVYYGSCRAFLSAADEDFGIAAAEAQASGKPIIAYARSGTAEIIQNGITGILFQEQTVRSIIDGVKTLLCTPIRSQDCIDNAVRFGKKRFVRAMKEAVHKLYNDYKSYNNYISL